MENSFEKQLFSILSTNLSASKINNITKAAFDLIARKQHHTVVSVLTDFIMSCPKDYKLKACYVIDAIGRSIDSQLKRDGITEKDAMMSLIENELESWMPFIIQTDDTEKIKKLLDSWKKMKIFDVDKVEMILKTWFKANNNPSSLNNISTKSPQNLNNTDLLSILSNVQKPQPQPIVQSPMPTGLDPALVAQFIKQPELLQTYTKLLEQQLLSTLQPQVINQSQNYSPLVSPVPMSLPMNLPMTPNPQRVDYQRKQQPEPYKRNPNTQNEEFNIDDANQYIYTQAEGGCDNDHILVLSRTLYVGGFNSEVSRQDLMDYFGRFGPVDSIIMTIKKQNAFIKMRTREIASHALKCTHLSHLKGRQLKVGFGCGYGPKDSFDYRSGHSMIPLPRLTIQDKEWLVNSPIGGIQSGKLRGGITVEEPHINEFKKQDYVPKQEFEAAHGIKTTVMNAKPPKASDDPDINFRAIQ